VVEFLVNRALFKTLQWMLPFKVCLDITEPDKTLAHRSFNIKAVMHIMNDDVDSAEAGLNEGHSSFHKVSFSRTTLPFGTSHTQTASLPFRVIPC
jgi:hypothetical protein